MDSQVLHLDRLTDLDYHYAGLVMGKKYYLYYVVVLTKKILL
jgi:hypothetical protein